MEHLVVESSREREFCGAQLQRRSLFFRQRAKREEKRERKGLACAFISSLSLSVALRELLAQTSLP